MKSIKLQNETVKQSHQSRAGKVSVLAFTLSSAGITPSRTSISSGHHSKGLQQCSKYESIMQTLWSRIAQTRGSCRCPSCLTTANGVARRATAATSRRAPKYAHSSTLFYSGVFAAAATFDAATKQRRREQWDRAIAEVKQDLGQPADSSLQTEPVEEAVEETTECEVSHSPFDALEWGEQAQQEVVDSLGLQHQGRRQRKSRPRWPTNTGSPLNVHHLAPESMYATEFAQEKAATKRWSPKKVKTIEVSIDLLQWKLLKCIKDGGFTQAAADAVPEEYRETIISGGAKGARQFREKLQELRDLWKVDGKLGQDTDGDGFRLTRYHQDDLGDFHETLRQLNRALSFVFKSREEGHLNNGEAFAKISYNLAICNAPPNLQTYNMLLNGFSRARHDELFLSLTESIIHTHMRSNETTLSLVLGHFTKTGDATRFTRWVELMRGKHHGLALARRDIRINEAGAARLIPKEGEPHKIIQLPHHTPKVFGVLIEGVLKFAGFEAALGVCQDMGWEGWGLCMSGMMPLLADCVERADWESGQAVWRQVKALEEKSRREERVAWSREKIKLETYATMLHLCHKCGRKDDYRNVFEEALRAHQSHARLLTRFRQKVTCASAPLQEEETPQDSISRKCSSLETPKSSMNTPRSAEVFTLEVEDTSDVCSSNRNSIILERETLSDSSRHPVQLAQSRRKSPPRELLLGQLDGSLPPTFELDDYESRERPMSMAA